MTLREKIVQEIREHGPMRFSRYMEMCLYDPNLGYYSRNVEQFGKAGDFYTSSDVHAVFGRLLARQFEEMWRMLGRPEQIEILELGPGRGLFARDVLDWSEKKFSEFYQGLHYSLLERSPALRKRLESSLSSHIATGRASLIPVIEVSGCGAGALARDRAPVASDHAHAALINSELRPTGNAATSVVPTGSRVKRALTPEVPLIVFANEFFDALPVEVLSAQGALQISEGDGNFIETWLPASKEELEFLGRYSVTPEHGERIEVSLIAQDYMGDIAALIDRGFLLAIDYGYTQQEQRAGRHRGTLTAYRQHSISASHYEAPGEQDITAHVNFTALAAAAEQQGMLTQPLVTQSQFLMGIGEGNQFADAFEECRLPQERAKVALQLKHLITPAGMGETFQVLVASKGVAAERVAISGGLSFGRNANLH